MLSLIQPLNTKCLIGTNCRSCSAATAQFQSNLNNVFASELFENKWLSLLIFFFLLSFKCSFKINNIKYLTLKQAWHFVSRYYVIINVYIHIRNILHIKNRYIQYIYTHTYIYISFKCNYSNWQCLLMNDLTQ